MRFFVLEQEAVRKNGIGVTERYVNRLSVIISWEIDYILLWACTRDYPINFRILLRNLNCLWHFFLCLLHCLADIFIFFIKFKRAPKKCSLQGSIRRWLSTIFFNQNLWLLLPLVCYVCVCECVFTTRTACGTINWIYSKCCVKLIVN